MSRCWCSIEAREALGGADVGEVVDEGAPDPFAGRSPKPGSPGSPVPIAVDHRPRRWRPKWPRPARSRAGKGPRAS